MNTENLVPESSSAPIADVVSRAEIDMQVATAHKYPRSIKRFRDEAYQMVTLNEGIAESCIYALPRDGKVIEGPSARFAEVVASAWGNCRAGARVVNDQGEFVTAQGVFHDLERNVAITYEVQRRITDKNGRRYKPDMIGVTANAACSVALRNAILKGVPKAFWDDMYQAARKTVMGDVQTLANRRASAIKAFQSFGINEAQILAKLEVTGVEDITLEHLVTLRGLLTAIKEGDTTPEQAFSAETESAPAGPKPKNKSAQAQKESADAPSTSVSESAGETSIAPAKASQIAFIKAKAEGASISEAEIFKRFELTTLDGINIKQVDEILAFIANPMGD